MITRRQFVSRAATCATVPMGAQMVAARNDNGRAADPHFFIFMQVYGAWDVCLVFDPKDRDSVMPNGERQFDQPYGMSEVREYANGLRLPPDGYPLGSYADRFAIINGIDMQVDNGHIVDAMMSGFQSPRVLNQPFSRVGDLAGPGPGPLGPRARTQSPAAATARAQELRCLSFDLRGVPVAGICLTLTTPRCTNPDFSP